VGGQFGDLVAEAGQVFDPGEVVFHGYSLLL
jgi:hypothetical protein